MLTGGGEGEKSMFLVIFGANGLFVAVAEPPVEKLLIFSYILQCRLYV